MKTIKRCLIYLAAATMPVVLVCGVVTTGAASVKQKPRRRTWAPTGPIEGVVTPQDTDVTFLDRDERPDSVAPPRDPAAVVNGFLSSGHSALMVKVGEGHSEFTEKRNWIQTHWTGTVSEIVRLAADEKFAVGDTFRFDRATGDLSVAQAKVHARFTWLREVVPNSTYLVFARRNQGRTELVQSPQGLLTVFRVLDDGTLEGSELPTFAPNALEGQTLGKVQQLIRSWVAKGQ